MADLQPVEGKVKLSSDTRGADEAKSALAGFGGSMQRIGEIAAGLGLVKVAEDILNIGKAAATFAIDTSSKFEQWNMAFTSMLGSADKAAKLMSEISDFAVKTPFELPQLVEGSKRLLAYNVEAKNIVPTMEMLGNISAAIGTEKLPNLILAFGQVKAATHLTGMELRQFSEAGVPLLQALVDKANAAGGSWQTVGGAAKKTKVDIGEMNDKLAIANQQLKEAAGNAHTKESRLMSLKNTIQNYNEKIADAGTATEGTRKVWVKSTVTADEMIKRISDGGVSFEEVNGVLGDMTKKGGKFFDMMNQQSKTFGGTISNIKDQFSRFALAIMGFDMTSGSKTFGQLQKGTLFDMLKDGANALLEFLNNNKGQIVGAFTAVANAVKFLMDMSVNLGNHIKNAFTPVLKDLANLYEKHKVMIDTIGKALGITLYAAIVSIIYIAGWFLQGLTALTDYILTRFGPGLQLISDVINAVGDNWGSIVDLMKRTFADMVNSVISGINTLIDALNKVAHTSIGKISPMQMGTIDTKSSSGIKSSAIPQGGSILDYNKALSQQKAINSNGIVITNYNTFNTKSDPDAFAKTLGLQMSLIR